MKKCFVTKLNGVTKNDNLLRVGEMKLTYFRVSAATSKTQSFCIKLSKETVLRIVGEGYFTDSTLSQNLGKEMTIQDNFLTDVYTSNGDYDIIIPNKYSLVQLKFYPNSGTNSYEDRSNKAISINDFMGMKELNYVSLSSPKVTGNIAALESSLGLTYLNLYGTKVSGNISVLHDKVALTYLSVPEVSGEISTLSKLSLLTYLNASGLSGNISVFKEMQSMEQLSLTAGDIYGDLALLSKKCYFASFVKNNPNRTFSWSSRPSEYNIIALEGPVKLGNVDKMLSEQAACVKAIPSGNQSWYRTISVSGERTSVSDSAVSTLQSKGYTISVNK